jgi:hypothetical protein
VSDEERTAKLRARYGASDGGNYRVVDTIHVPHPYCVGTAHVAHAADNFCGRLGAEAIEDAERRGIARCEACSGRLRWDQHETALLISCRREIKGSDGQATPELHAYLLRCKPLCEADGFAGFSFLDERGA